MQRKEIGMKRIKKQIWLSEKENKELVRKAAIAGLSQSAVIRILITGYEPQEKPDERFYETMKQMYGIGHNINQIAAKASSLGFVDTPALKQELEKLAKFQLQIEQTYLLPVKSRMIWGRK